MPNLRRRKSAVQIETRAQPSNDSKRRRDEMRARWRRVIVEDFRTISAFRHAWTKGSQGQRTAETVYKYLQDEEHSTKSEQTKDPRISTVLAFAEMTGRSVGFLLTGSGPERLGESRPRDELANDVAAALCGALPQSLRDYGFGIDGLVALAILWIKTEKTGKALAPLVEIGSAMSGTSLPAKRREAILAAIEAASRHATAECDGLLTLDTRVLLEQVIPTQSTVIANPALAPTIDAMLSLARAKDEAREREEKHSQPKA